MLKLKISDKLKNKVKSLVMVAVCLTCSFGIFMVPNTNLSAQITNPEDPKEVENPCGDDGVDEIIHGERKGFLGCWGSDTTCKTKCK